jgi:UDP-N-acetyl-D-glucosamine dehydrogenase
VVQRLAAALDARSGIGLNGARILLVGVAYKKNVDDTRESPSFEILELLRQRGATVDYFDPFVPRIPRIRRYPELEGMQSVDLGGQPDTVYNGAVICTDHDNIDYSTVLARSEVLVDTRNALRNIEDPHAKIVKA